MRFRSVLSAAAFVLVLGACGEFLGLNNDDDDVPPVAPVADGAVTANGEVEGGDPNPDAAGGGDGGFHEVDESDTWTFDEAPDNRIPNGATDSVRGWFLAANGGGATVKEALPGPPNLPNALEFSTNGFSSIDLRRTFLTKPHRFRLEMSLRSLQPVASPVAIMAFVCLPGEQPLFYVVLHPEGGAQGALGISTQAQQPGMKADDSQLLNTWYRVGMTLDFGNSMAPSQVDARLDFINQTVATASVTTVACASLGVRFGEMFVFPSPVLGTASFQIDSVKFTSTRLVPN